MLFSPSVDALRPHGLQHTRLPCPSPSCSNSYPLFSRFVIAFLPGSKCLLISWLQSLSAVILESKKIKSVTVSIVSPSICCEAHCHKNIPYVACMLGHFSHVQLCATQCTVACQAPLSMGFSRQEYWGGLPCSPSGDLPDPRIEPASPTSAGQFFII